jgi:hypothetical protein
MQAWRDQPRTVAFGIWLASRGPLVAAGLVLAALGAVASIAVAIARHGQVGSRLPTTASTAIAWSAGATIAVGGALRALRRDREDGVLALLRARAVADRDYLWGRVVGLATVIAIAVGGATLVAGVAAISSTRAPLPILQSTLAALGYALAFSATMGPVAMATLGVRSRVGGYLSLLLVLVVPELLSPWTSEILPQGWHELTSIPAALTAVRAGIARPSAASEPMARALAGLVRGRPGPTPRRSGDFAGDR